MAAAGVFAHLVNIVLIDELIKEGEEGVEVMHDLQYNRYKIFRSEVTYSTEGFVGWIDRGCYGWAVVQHTMYFSALSLTHQGAAELGTNKRYTNPLINCVYVAQPLISLTWSGCTSLDMDVNPTMSMNMMVVHSWKVARQATWSGSLEEPPTTCSRTWRGNI